MKTYHSVAVASALFAAFLTLGMTNSAIGAATPEGRADINCPSVNSGFVHDKESTRLFLLYHNPAHGLIRSYPGDPSRSSTLSI